MVLTCKLFAELRLVEIMGVMFPSEELHYKDGDFRPDIDTRRATTPELDKKYVDYIEVEKRKLPWF